MRVELKVLNKEFYRVDKLGGSYYDIPAYQTDGAAGVDLKATRSYTIFPGETVDIPTGIAIHLGSGLGNTGFSGPHSAMGLLVPRSSWGAKGLALVNTVGIIDSDFQGQIIIKAKNTNIIDSRIQAFMLTGSAEVKRYAAGLIESIDIKAGDRIAQLVFVPILTPHFKIVEEFSEQTVRGENGWGSTSDE